MDTKFSFHKELHIASIEAKSDWHNLTVHSLLQNPTRKQPSINAFLGARYSRSADSVVKIASEVMLSGKDAAQRLAEIFYGYGHKSVGDMADLFICLENVSMLTAQRFFYSNNTHAGQERSTRYQDFSHPKFIGLPTKLKASKRLAQEYKQTLLFAMQCYSELLPATKAALAGYFKIDSSNKQELSALQSRTFDTVRYFLPLGLQTSLGVVMSARNWAEKISYYRSSSIGLEKDLAELIYKLLVPGELAEAIGYIPEADGLIRHTEPNYSRKSSTSKALHLLQELIDSGKIERHKTIPANQTETTEVKEYRSALLDLVNHYLLLAVPTAKPLQTIDNSLDTVGIGKIIFGDHNHHQQMGNVAQSGNILITGYADYGSLKDLVRHRSLEKFIPLLEDHYNIVIDLDREITSCFFLCSYLHIPELVNLKNTYEEKMIQLYSKIKSWVSLAADELEDDLVSEYGRYLFPHAHAVHYRFYGSIDDLMYTISLRTRNGGHISYRELTYSWLNKLVESNSFWAALSSKIPAVDCQSREQFIDRS